MKLKVDAISMLNAKACLTDKATDEEKKQGIRHLAEGVLDVTCDELSSRGAKASDDIARDVAELTKYLSNEFGVTAEEIANTVKRLAEETEKE